MQLLRREQRDRHVVRALDRVVVLEDLASRSAGKEQVAAFDEVNVQRRSTRDAKPVVEVLDETDAEAADLDVQLGAELEADRGRRERRRRRAVGGIPLDHHDAAVPVLAARQERGHTASHDGATDDQHVSSFRAAHGPMLAGPTLRPWRPQRTSPSSSPSTTTRLCCAQLSATCDRATARTTASWRPPPGPKRWRPFAS